MNEINWYELFANIVFASFGGIVKKIAEPESTVLEMKAYVFSALISLFVGLVAYFIMKHLNWDTYLTLAVTGVVGFAGVFIIYAIMGRFITPKDVDNATYLKKGMDEILKKEEKKQ